MRPCCPKSLGNTQSIPIGLLVCLNTFQLAQNCKHLTGGRCSSAADLKFAYKDIGSDLGMSITENVLAVKKSIADKCAQLGLEPGSVRLCAATKMNDAARVREAVEAGVDSLEHGNYMDEETLSMLADSHTVWVPTLVTVRNLLGCGRYEDEVLLPIIHQAEELVRIAFRKKAKVALGSDAGAYCVPHWKGICQEYQSFMEILGNSQEVKNWLEDGEKIIREKFRRN